MRISDEFISKIKAHPCVFVHHGSNGRRGSVMVFDRIERDKVVFKEVYCASLDHLYSGGSRRESSYSIRNLEPWALRFERNGEEEYHRPILVIHLIDDLTTELVGIHHAKRTLLNDIKSQAYRLYDEWLDVCTPNEDQTNNERGNTMNINLQTAAAIVDEEVTTIRARVKLRENLSRELTFLCHNSLASQLSAGDIVVVDSDPDHTMSINVAQVESVDTEPCVELNRDITYRWAFAKVDMTALRTLTERQEKLHSMLKDKQRSTTRASIMASLGLTPNDIQLLD